MNSKKQLEPIILEIIKKEKVTDREKVFEVLRKKEILYRPSFVDNAIDDLLKKNYITITEIIKIK